MAVSDYELGMAQEPFPIAESTRTDLMDYFEAGYEPRLFDPLQDEKATDRLLDTREQWREEGATVVFTSGVFDVMHANHRTYLLATKLSAVPTHFARTEAQGDRTAWQELQHDERRAYAAHAIGSGSIRQIVSVDGDLAVGERKGFSPTKGNMARPIYSWDSRVRDTLSAAIPLNGSPQAHLLADAVTMHDRVHVDLRGGPHAGIMDIGLAVQPDVWAVYHESQDIIDALVADRQGPNRSAGIQPVVIRYSDGVYSDRMLGGPFSTTALAKRISGAATTQAA